MPATSLSDTELIQASQAGQLPAFRHVVERYQNLVCAVAFSATGDRALSEDIGQETFVAAWTSLSTLHDPAKLKGWLCGTARNLSKMALRKRRREVVDTEGLDGQTDDVSALDEIIDAEQAIAVRTALAEVPETYRETLVLFYREEQSLKQVAEAMGLSEDVVKQRLSRGRQSLKQEVIGMLEHTLAGSRPRKAFATGVLALIAARAVGVGTAAAATAAPSSGGAAAARATGAAKGMVAALLLAALLIGALIVVLATRGDSESRPGSAQRAGSAPRRAGGSAAASAFPRSAPSLSAATLEEVDRALEPRQPQTIFEVVDILGGPIAGAEVIKDKKLVGRTDQRGLLIQSHTAVDIGTIRTFRVSASGYAGEKATFSGYGRVTIALVPESTISGRVISAATHAPLAGIRVFANGLEPVTSNADGEFAFDRVAVGRYQMLATAPGLRSIERGPIDVGLHMNKVGVVIEMENGFTVAGRVSFTGARPDNLRISGGGAINAEVEADGRFRIEGLTPGTYHLTPDGRAHRGIDVTVVDRDVEGVELPLGALHELKVRAVRADGTGVGGVSIMGENTYEPGMLTSVSCTTDERGHCRISGIVPGKIEHLKPRIPGTTERDLVVPGETEIRFEVPPLGSVSGLVVDGAGHFLPWRIITLKLVGAKRGGGTVITDAKGRFLFGGLAAGSYAVDVYAYDHRSFAAYLTDTAKQPIGTATVAIAGGRAVTDVRIATTFVNGAITGVVKAVDGTPIPEALVTYTPENPNFTRGSSPVGLATVITDDDGRFTFVQVDATRKYDVRAQGPNGEQGRMRNVVAGANQGDLIVAPPAELRVTITGNDRTKVARVVIENAGDTDEASILPSVATDARFVGLRPGIWKITVTSGKRVGTASVEVGESALAAASVVLLP